MTQGKILLVDDSPSIREVLEDKISEAGYVVYSAENGKEAIGLLENFTPDMVITDVSMPEMDGFALCRYLKAEPRTRDIPVIMLTAATEQRDVLEGLGLGASDYIRKPFNPAELILRMNNILKGAQEKRRIQEIFARHTSPEVVQVLLDRPEDLMLSGEIRDVTVLFADIRGFTQLASGVEPNEIVRDLNLYLTVMSEAVLAEEGTLDKFLGDGIMAVFGAPLKQEDDTFRAVRAAVKIQKQVSEINDERMQKDLRQMWAGIGISAGPAVVGNIGSPRRMEYTVIGDCVNVASRIQSLAAAGQIIVSEDVYLKIYDKMMVEVLEAVSVKGKASPINIYSIII
jgi:adenylate cyclase